MLVKRMKTFHQISYENILDRGNYFRQLAKIMPALILIYQDKRFQFVNDYFIFLLGYSKKELYNMDYKEIVNEEYRTVLKQHSQNLLRHQENSSRCELVIRTKKGDKLWIDFSAGIVDFADKPAILGVGYDITEQKTMQDSMRYRFFHDSVTDLYNRTYLEMKFIELNHEEFMPLSVAVCDINGLRLINDIRGYKEGNRILAQIARVLIRHSNKANIIGRWGGDEFMILMPHTTEKEAEEYCSQISFECDVLSESDSLQYSISLGTACKWNPEQSIETIVKDAENRMYHYKLFEDHSIRSSIINSLQQILISRSYPTEQHAERMCQHAAKFAEILELSHREKTNLLLLAKLHDIGKIAVPDNILNKPEALTEAEWVQVKTHSKIGYRIALSCPEINHLAECILTHHERWDGKGYPLGLKAEEIPLMARIIAILDAYDAMVNGRPYQISMQSTQALKEIQHCAGTQFDPDLVRLFVKYMQEIINYQYR